MAQSIRVSDDVYHLAAEVGAAQSRSLAQQVEHWVRLGIALDAAGLTTAQEMKLFGGDPKGLQHAAAQVPVVNLGGRPEIEAFHRRVGYEVAKGMRSAESSMAFSRTSPGRFKVQLAEPPDLVQEW